MAKSTSFLDDTSDIANYLPANPEDDEEQAITPEFSRMGGGSDSTPEQQVFGTPVATAAPAAPAPTPGEQAAKNAADLLGQRPERPKPGFWRSLGSIGAGLAAGYSNATGKPGMPQVDVGAVMDGVKYGGYNRKVSNWQNQVSDAEAQAKTLQTAEAEQKANAAQQSTANLQTQEAGYYKAHAQELGQKHNTRYIKLPGSAGIYDTQTDTIINGPGKQLVPLGAGGLYNVETGEVIGAPDHTKPPKALTTTDFLVQPGPDGKLHNYLPDPDSPTDPTKKIDYGIAKPPVDPLEGIRLRDADTDARQQRTLDQQTTAAISAASTQQQGGLRSAEDKAAQSRRELEKVNSHGHILIDKNSPEYKAKLQEIADQLQRDKQLVQNGYEQVMAQHGRQVPHVEYGNPMLPPPSAETTAPKPGAPPAGAPAAAPPITIAPHTQAKIQAKFGGNADAALKAYADKNFGGDIAKAKAAIAAQQGAR